MYESEITLKDIIDDVENFCPVKVIFNDTILYNDYDSNKEIEDGVYGETQIFSRVAPSRIENFKNYLVTSINIKIVNHHHSIIDIQGRSPNEVLNYVDVVRCKDCKYRHTETCPMYHKYYIDNDYDYGLVIDNYTEDDGFCHLGEWYEEGERYEEDD